MTVSHALSTLTTAHWNVGGGGMTSRWWDGFSIWKSTDNRSKAFKCPTYDQWFVFLLKLPFPPTPTKLLLIGPRPESEATASRPMLPMVTRITKRCRYLLYLWLITLPFLPCLVTGAVLSPKSHLQWGPVQKWAQNLPFTLSLAQRSRQLVRGMRKWTRNLRTKIRKCVPTKRNRERNDAFQKYLYHRVQQTIQRIETWGSRVPFCTYAVRVASMILCTARFLCATHAEIALTRPLLPRVINFKFLLQPHKKYYITQHGELGFS